MNDTFMKEKPIFSLIVSMSLPMMISMLVNALYNIMDSLFVARISENAMTALSLVFPVQNLINSIGVGFGIGLNALISYCLGAGDKRRANVTATVGVLLALGHGVVMTFLSLLCMRPFLSAFTSSEEIIDLGMRYSNVVFLFVIINVLGLAFEKIFQAAGRMKVSMIGLMIGCIANIILDPLLIWGIGLFPEMGMEGAALATGLGQTFTLIFYIVVYVKRSPDVQISRKYLSFDRQLIARAYAVGIPATLNMALPSVLISVLNAILAAFSAEYVLVLGIYNKLQTFLYLPANGLIQGMRPIVGYNYGAGEKARVRQTFRIVLMMSAVIMLAGTVICLIIPGQLIGLFTHVPQTIAIGKTALRIICAGFVVSSISVTVTGVLEGLGKGTPSLVISLLRYVIVIIPAAFIFSRLFGAVGVWHAFWFAELITAVCAGLIYRKLRKDTLSGTA